MVWFSVDFLKDQNRLLKVNAFFTNKSMQQKNRPLKRICLIVRSIKLFER